ncbi:ribosome maturation factor RimM [Helicobacter suis]|uniref:ribosome maturation factor RimM n=1 Tax=Helicobacter suis TaxID=104628 RepID=UPI0013D8D3FE|nr:ribosome maturation factor RimM [Helicobacter suis]
MKIEDLLVVGVIGRCVGLAGGLKLFLKGNCLECLQKGAQVYAYHIGLPRSLSIKQYIAKPSLIFFERLETPELAKTLTGYTLAMSEEETLKYCHLAEGEFLYSQLIGLEIEEEGMILGRVVSVDDLASMAYLRVQNSNKSFLIPYIARYILRVDLSTQRIYTQDSKGLLEES